MSNRLYAASNENQAKPSSQVLNSLAGSAWQRTSSPDSTLCPVLASTQLCLQLLLQDGAPELRSMVELLGRDPGAVLRTFAAAAEECSDLGDRPERLQDCIVSLDLSKLQRVLDQPSCSRAEQARLVAFAQQGAEMARLCRTVAASLGLCEEQAQLVGLLHSLGSLPSVIGCLAAPDRPDEAAAVASGIARAHHLPPALVEALDAVHRRDTRSVWFAMLQAAQDLAETQLLSRRA